MIIVPKEEPAVENLNSYYLDIRKLIEHYQGEIGSACIHFEAPSAKEKPLPFTVCAMIMLGFPIKLFASFIMFITDLRS